jgi:hypothetical protein
MVSFVLISILSTKLIAIIVPNPDGLTLIDLVIVPVATPVPPRLLQNPVVPVRPPPLRLHRRARVQTRVLRVSLLIN